MCEYRYVLRVLSHFAATYSIVWEISFLDHIIIALVVCGLLGCLCLQIGTVLTTVYYKGIHLKVSNITTFRNSQTLLLRCIFESGPFNELKWFTPLKTRGSIFSTT